MLTDVFVSIGNGPSLKQEYFDILKTANVHTIGMNAAYRFYREMNWWPTYFCCFDYALTETHRDAWCELILDPDVPIQKYFFIDVTKSNKAINPALVFPKEVRNHPKFVGKPNNQCFIGYPKFGVKKKMASTGANSVRVGIELGYKNIVLIGHDCSYKQAEKFKEAEHLEGWKYQFKETPKENPNYFWKGYQRKGDIFNKPGDQLPAWRHLKECIAENAPDVTIFNCSQGTRINYWKVMEFEPVIRKIEKSDTHKAIEVSPSHATELNIPFNKLDHIVKKLSGDEKDRPYAQFLRGKTVAIVGPAEITKGKGEGEYIDSFDEVIRFNTVFRYMPFTEEQARDIGSKTSILYLCPSGVVNFMQKQTPEKAASLIKSGIRYIVYQNNHKKHKYRYTKFVHQGLMGKFSEKMKEMEIEIPMCYSNKTMAGLSKILTDYSRSNVVARTGCLSIFDSLIYGASKIAIKGMTFYHGGGHLFREVNGELDPLRQHANKKSPHNSILELELMKKLLKLYADRFIIDDELGKLLS